MRYLFSLISVVLVTLFSGEVIYADNFLTLVSPYSCTNTMGAGGNIYSNRIGLLSAKCEGNGIAPIIKNNVVTFGVGNNNLKYKKDRSELAYTERYFSINTPVIINFDLKGDINSDVTNTWFYLLQFWQDSSHPPIGGLRINRKTSDQAMFIFRNSKNLKGAEVATTLLSSESWNSYKILIYPSSNNENTIVVWQNNRVIGTWSGNIGYYTNGRYRVKFGIYKGQELGKTYKFFFKNFNIEDGNCYNINNQYNFKNCIIKNN